MDSRFILSQDQLNEIIQKHNLSNTDNTGEIMNILHNIFIKMALIDIESICTKTPTVLAYELERYVKNTMITINKTLCFWSCREGKEKALAQKEYSIDNDYPIIKLLFEYCTVIRENMSQHHDLMTSFSCAISRLFVSSIKDIALPDNIPRNVHVFMGSDKSTENVGFHVGNNFWEAELPILKDYSNKGYIEDIILHIFENGSNIRNLSMNNDVINLPLWRRN